MFAADMQKEPDEAIDAFLEMLTPYLSLPKMSSVQAQQLLLKAYQLRYGFTTLATLQERPASLVCMHSAEDPFRGHTREDHMDDFIELRIGELFKIDFFQYLAQPRHELRTMRDKAAVYAKRKNTAEQNSLSEAERLAKQLGASR